MVVPKISGQNAKLPGSLVDEPYQALTSFIVTEEHALAWISRSRIKLKHSDRVPVSKPIRKFNTNSIAPLSIEFDVTKQANNSTQLKIPQNIAVVNEESSTQPVTKAADDVAIEPEAASNLLYWSQVSLLTQYKKIILQPTYQLTTNETLFLYLGSS